jgi:hypothetical protein
MEDKITIKIYNAAKNITLRGKIRPNATLQTLKDHISREILKNELSVIIYFDKQELSDNTQRIGDIIRNSPQVIKGIPVFEFKTGPPPLPEQPPQEPLTEEQINIFDSEHIETLPLLNAHIGQIFNNRLGDERENTFCTTPESNLGIKMNNNTDKILQQCKTMYSSGNSNDCLIHSFLTVYCPNFRRLSMKDKNVVAHNFRIYVYPNTNNYIMNKGLDDLVYDFIKREGRETNEDDFFNIERLEAEAAKAAEEAAGDARRVRRNVLEMRAVAAHTALDEARARILGVRSPYRKGQDISFAEVKKYITSVRRALESPDSKETDYNIERRVKEPVYLTDKDLSNLCQDYNCKCVTFSRLDNVCAIVGADNPAISMIYNSGGHYEGVRYGEPPLTTYIIKKGLAAHFERVFTIRLARNNGNRRPPNAAPIAAPAKAAPIAAPAKAAPIAARNAANVLRNMRLTQEEKWICGTCTFANPNSSENCEVCGALRPPDPKRILTEPITQFEEKYREQIKNRFNLFRPRAIRAFENVETFLFYLNITPEDFIEEIKKTGDMTHRIPKDMYYLDDYIRLSKATGVPFINMINIGRIIMINSPDDWSTINSKGHLLLSVFSEKYKQRVNSNGVALSRLNNAQKRYDNMLEKIKELNIQLEEYYEKRRDRNPFLTDEELSSIVYPKTTDGGARTRRKLRGRKSRGTRRKF